MMKQHNPPHPGEFINRVYLESKNWDLNTFAQQLQISLDEFNRLLSGKMDVKPVLASTLSNVLGRTPECWMSMQHNYELWNFEQGRK